jgi:Mrp family chromosome partitioning ATPase
VASRTTSRSSSKRTQNKQDLELDKTTLEQETDEVADPLKVEQPLNPVAQAVDKPSENQVANDEIVPAPRAITKVEEAAVTETLVDEGSSLELDTASAKSKGGKLKLSAEEKKARTLALQLANASRDLDARLYRVYEQLDEEPSLDNPLVIGITSSLRGEGRSTVALGFASIVARSVPFPVLLVETDLGQGSSFLSEDNTAYENTLANYLRGETSFDELAHQSGVGELHYIPAGIENKQALRLLRSNRLDDLFERARRRFGVIVLDMPPMVLSAEVGRLISLSDKVIMVVEAGSTPRRLVASNLEYLGADKLGGIVLNRTTPSGPRLLRKLFGL